MKVLSTDGLTKLIQLIKSAFISVDDTVTTTTVALADVATSGSYNDLSDKPTIPAAQVQADWDVTDTTSKAFIKNKPYIPSGVVVDQTYDSTSTNAQSGVAINGAGFLQNTATGTNAITILGDVADEFGAMNIGYNSTASTVNSVALGYFAKATGIATTSVGYYSEATHQGACAIGYLAKAQGNNATSLGHGAIAGALQAIQIGEGTNQTAQTLQIGFGTNNNYTLLDGTTGLIPDARISSNIARTSAIPTESTVSGWGFTKNTGTVTSVNNVSPVNGNVSLTIPTVNDATLTIQKNGTTVKTFTANASSNVTANITVPTSISDLTDDTSTTPIDKADTLTGLTASVTELNYVDGVTSSIQTQIDGKADTTLSNVSSIDSSSAVQTALDGKVSKSGDTMTGKLTILCDNDNNGNLIIQNTDVDFVNGVSATRNTYFTFNDVNDVTISELQSHFTATQNRMTMRVRPWGNTTTSVSSLPGLFLDANSDGSLVAQFAGMTEFIFPKCTTNATKTSTASDSKVAVIVQNYKSGASWYRVWSDGWIEQGGYSNSTGAVTVSLLKPFNNTNYTIQVTQKIVSGDRFASGENNATTKTKNSFGVYTATSSNYKGFYWHAYGY